MNFLVICAVTTLSTCGVIAKKAARKIFAADNLGISLDQIRKLESKGFFDGAVPVIGLECQAA